LSRREIGPARLAIFVGEVNADHHFAISKKVLFCLTPSLYIIGNACQVTLKEKGVFL
jgi:hypothetical protein